MFPERHPTLPLAHLNFATFEQKSLAMRDFLEMNPYLNAVQHDLQERVDDLARIVQLLEILKGDDLDRRLRH